MTNSVVRDPINSVISVNQWMVEPDFQMSDLSWIYAIGMLLLSAPPPHPLPPPPLHAPGFDHHQHKKSSFLDLVFTLSTFIQANRPDVSNSVDPDHMA